jgi:hypothetical protein
MKIFNPLPIICLYLRDKKKRKEYNDNIFAGLVMVFIFSIPFWLHSKEPPRAREIRSEIERLEDELEDIVGKRPNHRYDY